MRCLRLGRWAGPAARDRVWTALSSERRRWKQLVRCMCLLSVRYHTSLRHCTATMYSGVLLPLCAVDVIPLLFLQAIRTLFLIYSAVISPLLGVRHRNILISSRNVRHGWGLTQTHLLSLITTSPPKFRPEKFDPTMQCFPKACPSSEDRWYQIHYLDEKTTKWRRTTATKTTAMTPKTTQRPTCCSATCPKTQKANL